MSQIYQNLRRHIPEYDANWTQNLHERLMGFLTDLKILLQIVQNVEWLEMTNFSWRVMCM
jgi:hypothetical protein